MTSNRHEILSINPVFTAHLLHYQDLKYNPKTALLHEGQQIILRGTMESTILDKHQARKLNQENLKYFNDHKDDNPFNSELELNITAEFGLKSGQLEKDAYLNDLGTKLEELRQFLGQKNLLILAEWPTPWLSQDHPYPPVKNALNYLKSKIKAAYVGGFILQGSDIIEFIPHLFWLIRCNAGLADVRFAFNDSTTVFSLCKYGVLHIDFYDSIEQTSILNFFKNKSFSEIQYCNDPVDFDR